MTLNLVRRCLLSSNNLFNVRYYAAPGSGIPSLGKKGKLAKTGPTLEKKEIPVETDPVRLQTYVCGSNINVEGEDVKLQDDSEYPDWLWKLNTGPPPPLEELDPDNYYYWYRRRKLGLKKKNSLQKLKKF